MTQVAQIFEAEKRQALAQAAQIFEEEKKQAAQIFEEEKRQALKENEQRVIQDTSKQLVIRMINKNYSSEEIVSLVPNYSQNDVDALRKELMDGNDTKP